MFTAEQVKQMQAGSNTEYDKLEAARAVLLENKDRFITAIVNDWLAEIDEGLKRAVSRGRTYLNVGPFEFEPTQCWLHHLGLDDVYIGVFKDIPANSMGKVIWEVFYDAIGELRTKLSAMGYHVLGVPGGWCGPAGAIPGVPYPAVDINTLLQAYMRPTMGIENLPSTPNVLRYHTNQFTIHWQNTNGYTARGYR